MPAGTANDVCVGYATHPEGEGGLDLVVSARETPRLRLHLFTSPHFAQLSLVGRPYHEVPAAVAGTCATSAACHQITAIRAMEAALGIQTTPQMDALRRILLLAQWIQGHALHIYFLAAPGLLGYANSFALASAHPEVVQRALRLKKLGMELTGAVGGRRATPLSLRIGGTSRLPSRAEIDRARLRLERGRADATDTVVLVSGLSIPPLTHRGEHVALREGKDYPVHSGRITSTAGLDVPVSEYDRHIRKRGILDGGPPISCAPDHAPILVGPLARLNLNRDRLGHAALQALKSCGLSLPSMNPLGSVVARAVELVQAIEECAALLDSLELQDEDVRFEVAAGEGAAATESPRGLLYHRYSIDAGGMVREAEIASPTSHNIRSIEDDLRTVALQTLDAPSDDLRLRLEMLVRSYDPCATCSRDVPGLSLCLDA